MATQNTAIAREPISFNKAYDLGLAGLIRLLADRAACESPRFNSFGKLSPVELVTLSTQSRNASDAIRDGLALIGDMTSAYNPDVGEVDNNRLGWIVRHLAETLGEVLNVSYCASQELLLRGYDSHGKPISAKCFETAETDA